MPILQGGERFSRRCARTLPGQRAATARAARAQQQQGFQPLFCTLELGPAEHPANRLKPVLHLGSSGSSSLARGYFWRMPQSLPNAKLTLQLTEATTEFTSLPSQILGFREKRKRDKGAQNFECYDDWLHCSTSIDAPALRFTHGATDVPGNSGPSGGSIRESFPLSTELFPENSSLEGAHAHLQRAATARAARTQQGRGFQPFCEALVAAGPSTLEIASNPCCYCVLAGLALWAGVCSHAAP